MSSRQWNIHVWISHNSSRVVSLSVMDLYHDFQRYPSNNLFYSHSTKFKDVSLMRLSPENLRTKDL